MRWGSMCLTWWAQATQLGPRRSNYVASIVAYSGGLVMNELKPRFQAPANKFPALLFHGGPRDEYIVNFQRTTRDYASLLRARGHKTVICNHKGGHVLPRGGGLAAYQFFKDHPFRLPHGPEEQAGDLPDYCGLLKQGARARR
jgi:predicted esterase